MRILQDSRDPLPLRGHNYWLSHYFFTSKAKTFNSFLSRGEASWLAAGTGELKKSPFTKIGWGVYTPQPIFSLISYCKHLFNVAFRIYNLEGWDATCPIMAEAILYTSPTSKYLLALLPKECIERGPAD